MSDDIHEIYAIRYGHHDRKSSENFIGSDPHDVLQPLDFYVWAIVGRSGPIILDTGFDAAVVSGSTVSDSTSPASIGNGNTTPKPLSRTRWAGAPISGTSGMNPDATASDSV